MSTTLSRETAAPEAPVTRPHPALRALRSALIPTASIIVLIGLWQALVAVANIPSYTLPAPSEIARRMYTDAGLLTTQAIPTTRSIVLGFLLAVVVSVPLAVGLVYWSPFNRIVYPLLVVSQVVPKIALAPLFVIWVGFGDSSKILMAFLISFFPIVIDAAVGLGSVRPGSITLFRSMGAGRWNEFWRLRLPHSLPQLFAGLKVGITFAVVGEIVGEFVGADQGLGYQLTQARGNLDTVLIFAVIAYLVIIGAILFGIVEALELWLLRSRPRAGAAARTGA